MDEFIGVIWLLFFVAIIAMAIYFQSVHTKTQNSAYRRVASRLRGNFATGTLFQRPSLHFPHNGTVAQVETIKTGGKNSRYYTLVQIGWPDAALRCEIYPEQFGARLGKMLGMTDMEIGSPAFDRDFIITANSLTEVRRILTPEVQQAIYRLRRMGRGDDIYMSIGGGKMTVRKLGLLVTEQQLTDHLNAVLELYDLSLGNNKHGIEFLGEASVSEMSEAICQICGESITHDRVHCRRCKTPHHEDCWQYFGGCSTFGCGEKRFVASKV